MFYANNNEKKNYRSERFYLPFCILVGVLNDVPRKIRDASSNKVYFGSIVKPNFPFQREVKEAL